MRLINPGPGELLDRLTILELKIKYATVAKRSINHFEGERQSVLDLLNPFFANGGPWSEWIAAMQQINIRVWLAIDYLRDTPEEDYKEAARWGRVAMYGNDERAKLIHEINEACGASIGQEKLVLTK